MSIINILDNDTINLIAAGEVVERPSSVVKELVANALDAGSDKITIEIKGGGKDLIRVTDNGSGIYKDDIPKAFMRHATSKIKTADDLSLVLSMGFRGEALSSISQVSKTELTTKRQEDLLGSHVNVDGGDMGPVEEIGAPAGTTIIIRNLFYNTPARLKFLKSETSETGAVFDVIQHLSLARPDVAFRFISNGKERIATTGRGDVKEVIYRLYGRETSNELVPIDYTDETGHIYGFLGTPSENRASRNQETYFINNRYVKNPDITNGIEEGYREYLMQHKFPFCVLHIDLDTESLDVNVHPAKLEVRFFEGPKIFDFVSKAVSEALYNHEMIGRVKLADEESKAKPKKVHSPEFFETSRIEENNSESESEDFFSDDITEEKPVETPINTQNVIPEKTHGNLFKIDFDESNDEPVITENKKINEPVKTPEPEKTVRKPITPAFEQMTFIDKEERVLSRKAASRYKIIGQIFDTYWIIQYSDSVYFIDQHAAHEKVNYERIMKRMLNDEKHSQLIMPPIVVSLSGSEYSIFEENREHFEKIGFICDEAGGYEIALRGIPHELYFNEPKSLFMSLLNELSNNSGKVAPKDILSNIATMACKASVKGGDALTDDEIHTLIDELLACDNPYHCPHGRPTIFSMSRTELEKKFKRIVD